MADQDNNAANSLILYADEKDSGLLLAPIPDGRLQLQNYSATSVLKANLDRGSVIRIRDFLDAWLKQ